MGLFRRGMLRINKIQRQIDIVSGDRVLGPRASVTSGDEAAPDNSFTAATITRAGGLDSGQLEIMTVRTSPSSDGEHARKFCHTNTD